MSLSLIVGTDTVDAGLRVKTNAAINKIPTGYSIVNGLLTVTKFDTTTDTITLPSVRDQIISGGGYAQTNNLTFAIDPTTWVISNQTYTELVGDSFTLSDGDAVSDRYDVIVVDTDSSIVKIEGTASGTPVLPTITVNQLMLMAIYVPANATSSTSDAVVTYWGGYTTNTLDAPNTLSYYKEQVNKGAAGATGASSVAIGPFAKAEHSFSIVIGGGTSTASGQTLLKNNTVNITAPSGASYTADYSANFTDRSLVDKGYVTSGLSNYLPLSGGTMTGDISMSGTNKFIYWDGGNNGIGYNNSNNSFAMFFYDNIEETNTVFRLEDDTLFAFGDSPTFKGITYDIDYSANYTDRSLVDRGYTLATFLKLLANTLPSSASGLSAGDLYTQTLTEIGLSGTEKVLMVV
jgi:hypothetical protein